ncbi:hypothetical protein [Desulforamulus ferrireducens]|uniref:hypothetical protein n=1 Tax=Desulforamulus ferrireducens TaxID=1833852 RepID=UPI0013565C58|nr:hypothetical protein [Desulforamulus ferrireducens]
MITEGYSHIFDNILGGYYGLWIIGYFIYDILTLNKQIEKVNDVLVEQALQRIMSLSS